MDKSKSMGECELRGPEKMFQGSEYTRNKKLDCTFEYVQFCTIELIQDFPFCPAQCTIFATTQLLAIFFSLK